MVECENLLKILAILNQNQQANKSIKIVMSFLLN